MLGPSWNRKMSAFYNFFLDFYSFLRILFPCSSHWKAHVHTLLCDWLHFSCTALFIQYTYIDDTCGSLCISGTTMRPNWPLTIRTVRSPSHIRRIRAMNSSASSKVFNWLIMLRNVFWAAKFFLSFTEASSQNMLNVSKLSSSFCEYAMDDAIFWWFSMCMRITWRCNTKHFYSQQPAMKNTILLSYFSSAIFLSFLPYPFEGYFF